MNSIETETSIKKTPSNRIRELEILLTDMFTYNKVRKRAVNNGYYR